MMPAAAFQLVILRSGVMLTIASNEESTIAATRTRSAFANRNALVLAQDACVRHPTTSKPPTYISTIPAIARCSASPTVASRSAKGTTEGTRYATKAGRCAARETVAPAPMPPSTNARTISHQKHRTHRAPERAART
jgi:hypothetical protein